VRERGSFFASSPKGRAVVPRGAGVVERVGNATRRTVTWVGAAGQQCWERLGTASDGWTRQQAERELGKMPARVGRERWRKPEPLTFRAFSERFMDDYLPGRNLKAMSVVTRLAVRLVTARKGLCAAVPAPYVRAAGTSPDSRAAARPE
jgi:hypothetical protein